jgi:hypothetical protein
MNFTQLSQNLIKAKQVPNLDSLLMELQTGVLGVPPGVNVVPLGVLGVSPGVCDRFCDSKNHEKFVHRNFFFVWALAAF